MLSLFRLARRLHPSGRRAALAPEERRWAMSRCLSLEPLEDRRLLSISLSTFNNFEDGTAQEWSHGAPSPNPPTIEDGGPDGAGDNYLQNSSRGFGGRGSRQVMFNRGAAWTGDYLDAKRPELKLSWQTLGIILWRCESQ